MTETKTSQQPVIDFLIRPENHGGTPVTRIDTHAAMVFLAGNRAIKIKRAVRFPYLDFSTLEKRKAACEAELDVNRNFAPGIYRRVVAITRESDGHLAIDGSGSPIEWAVEMHRFDERKTFDHLADEDRVDARLADSLGRMVARAHEGAPVMKHFDFVSAMENIIAQNDAELRATTDLLPPEAVHALTEQTRAALIRVQALLTERERNGLVRRCHGDLHLGNIVLIEGEPVLFDALEFDERTATTDTLYDLAFLLTDLIERGLQTTANIVLNRYLTETRHRIDLDGLKALPLFMAIRATIRAKVTAALRPHSKAREKVSRKARDYFELAQRLIAPLQPQLIAIGGLSGTGKSLLARALAPAIAPAPGAVILRSDVERKAMLGAVETEKLPPEAYSHEVSKQVYAALTAKACHIVSAGHSAIVDAVFADPYERAEIRQTAGNAVFHGLFLTAKLETRIVRLGSRTYDVSDADVAVARSQEQYELGAMDWVMVDASGTLEETMRIAEMALRNSP